MKKVFLTSFASAGREQYNAGQLRLIKSVKDSAFMLKYSGKMHMRSFDGYCDEYAGQRIYTGQYPVSKEYGLCPHHSQTPYAFKPFIIQECIEQGAEQIIWCDSTIVMMNDPQPLLNYAAAVGVCAFNNEGYPLKDWISDIACQRLDIEVEELELMQQIMACVIVFDITHPAGRVIFNEWMKLCIDGGAFQDNGSKRQGFRAHRHDQAVLSALLYQHGVPLLPYGKLCYSEHLEEHKDEVIFLNKGL